MLPHHPKFLSAVVAMAASAALLASLHSTALARPTAVAGQPDTPVAAAVVSGVVFDSLDGKPLAGALVQVVARGENARAWNATSGADGAFAIPGVPRGLYIVGFMHPVLDSLGLTVQPRTIEVSADDAVDVKLAIPSAHTIRQLLCDGTHPSDSTGLLLGFIRDADTGAPLPGATAVVTWPELVVKKGIHTERRKVPIRSNDAGWYALCGAPADGPLAAHAELGKDASGVIEVNVPPGGVLRRDFYVPRGAAAVAVSDSQKSDNDRKAPASAELVIRHGNARLSGVVRNAQGQPLSGAQLLVWGSGISGSTRDDGSFTLSGLPAGTQALEARYVGYAPRRVAVDLASNETRSVTVTLDQRADVLDQVTVYGKATKRRGDINGFLERRLRGMGHYFTRADIARMQPFEFTDIMRRIPGIKLVPTSYFDFTILSSRGAGVNPSGTCQPTIYVDGTRLIDDTGINAMLLPGDVAALEVYPGPAGAPAQYSDGKCGSILVWTGPDPDR
jgi:hypothetical protein